MKETLRLVYDSKPKVSDVRLIDPEQNLYGTCTEPKQNLYGTFAEPVRNLNRT